MILNNLEFDHADIYPDLAAIKQQFHYLLRSVPQQGCIFVNNRESALRDVLDNGCWSSQVTTAVSTPADWSARLLSADGSHFECWYQGALWAQVSWPLWGEFNVSNALAATALAHHIGISREVIVSALASFSGVAKRMECVLSTDRYQVYRDFAHHPTAITGAIRALRHARTSGRLIVMLELGSRTMQRHVDVDALAQALQQADRCVVLDSDDIQWPLEQLCERLSGRCSVAESALAAWHAELKYLKDQDTVLLLSNKNFAGLVEQLACESVQ